MRAGTGAAPFRGLPVQDLYLLDATYRDSFAIRGNRDRWARRLAKHEPALLGDSACEHACTAGIRRTIFRSGRGNCEGHGAREVL